MSKTLFGHGPTDQPIELSADDRATHMHVIGSSGSGKSKFLELMMRNDLKNLQGFCLIDPHGTLYRDVLNYCAYRVIDQEIILLNLSEPSHVVGFNPFRSREKGDISVQVDRRISATMHAWGVENADQTPTLERTLRLVYTTLIEQNLSFHQAQFLIDFNSKEIRESLIRKLRSPLIQREWDELQQLKAKDWRAEILSAKNRLFRLLSSKTLARFLGGPGESIDIEDIIENGKILLVNLAPSDYLSTENARVFGSLLVNEFFEVASRRDAEQAQWSTPYYLYLDEFQTFVSIDVTAMLDEARKRKLFAVLAHQRFGQLGHDLSDAILTNCKIKAVFGGLPVEMAKMMAQELFIGELDSKKIKAAIYQTKFWPKYSRDRVFTNSSSIGLSKGTGENRALSSGAGQVEGQFFAPSDWFSSGEMVGQSLVSSSATNQVSGEHSSETEFSGDAYGEADVPIMMPVPFQELSGVQFYSPEEQLLELTAALKEQFGRHCFIKIRDRKTQPMRVPFVKTFYTSQEDISWYEKRLLKNMNAKTAEEIDRMIDKEEEELIAGLKAVPGPRSKKKVQADILGRE